MYFKEKFGCIKVKRYAYASRDYVLHTEVDQKLYTCVIHRIKLTFDLFFVSFLLAVDDIVDDILGDVLGKSFHRFKAINGMFA